MKFSVVVLALATSALALPNLGPSARGSGKGKGKDDKHFAVPDDLTVNQAQTKCGSDNKLNCCNKVTYAEDTNAVSSGLLSLAGLLGGVGPGAQAIGLFDGCSPLIGDLVNHQCENIAACCQNSPSSATGLVAVGIPCLTLAGLL